MPFPGMLPFSNGMPNANPLPPGYGYLGTKCEQAVTREMCMAMPMCSWIFDDAIMECKETKEVINSNANHKSLLYGGRCALV